MKCPDCRREIPDVATACRCGWIAKPAHSAPPCAHCETEARMRVQDENGWKNVCDTHYEEHFRKQAERNCQAMWLVRKPGESAANYRLRVSAWIKDRVARLAERMAS
jgi:broad specificity phosphatase PhoE